MNVVLFNRLMMHAKDHYMQMEDIKHYHNYKHAFFVVETIKKLIKDPSRSLLLAGMYHDVVYIPGAGADANERCSAALLNYEYRKYRALGVSQEVENDKDIELSMGLIIRSTIDNHLTKERLDGDLAILLDADLASLAFQYSEFYSNQNRIILENYGDLKDDLHKSKRFLKQLLTCREYIYHTDRGREMFEVQARKNIQYFYDHQF